MSSNRKAIIIHVPFRLLKNFHRLSIDYRSYIQLFPGTDQLFLRIQQRLIRELEKKFSGKHVTIVAHRRILPREGRKNRTNKQKRPFSRTLTSVRISHLLSLGPDSDF